jgi:hypothetical protein
MDKQQPLGICDLCLGPIPRDEWYTRRGPRLHCSMDCKNTANSRAGASIRSRKVKRRVARGEWVNPASLNAPDPQNVSAGVSRARKAEVKAGTWKNPAITDKARAKLSRPRKHVGALHRAIEKLRHGSMKDLTDVEHKAWLKWRRNLRRARIESDRRYHRERYHRQQDALTPAERKTQRAKWRAQNQRRKKKRG